ncbi:MAG: DUF4405 domain-containing protein [Chloroflexi bacterium]|nr:DUF4405 domain-containing protein [Chloroflexota bacterium]
MSEKRTLSKQTRTNWLVDAALFASALAAMLSGVYFLYFPNGYQGGRNPLYDVTVIFSRATWGDVHTWGGVLMLLAVVIHFSIHWSWVKMMGKRIGKAARGQAGPMSRGAKNNLLVDVVIAICFVLAALSGVYFLFAPEGSAADPHFLFSRTTWDMIHTWSGTLMIGAALVHFAIHWGWIKKVTIKIFAALRPQSQSGVTVSHS